MEFRVEKKGLSVLSGTSAEYQIEVDQGGWGGQLGDGMLVTAIIRTVKRLNHDPRLWEAEESILVSLDKEAAIWLSAAIAGVSSGESAGLRMMFS
jgi:hypothetical protein